MAEFVEQLHGIDGVMARTDLGRSAVFNVIASGQLRSCKVGRRRLVSESALVEFIQNLDNQAADA